MNGSSVQRLLSSYGWSTQCCELAISLASIRLSKETEAPERSLLVALAILVQATWKSTHELRMHYPKLEDCIRFLSADKATLEFPERSPVLDEEIESLQAIYGDEVTIRESSPSSGILLSMELPLSKFSLRESLPPVLSHWVNQSEKIILEVCEWRALILISHRSISLRTEAIH
jgi:hypothetical protein